MVVNRNFQKLLFVLLLTVSFATQTFAVSKELMRVAAIDFKKGLVKREQGDNQAALKLFKSAFKLDPAGNIANNIANAYSDLKNYKEAISWYEHAIRLNPNDGTYYYNLALKYDNTKDFKNAIKYYKKAIAMGHISAIKNMSYLYRVDLKDNLHGIAYSLALIDKKYPKGPILDYIRNKLKIDEATLKKAYELQKTLVPNPYTGGIN